MQNGGRHCCRPPLRLSRSSRPLSEALKRFPASVWFVCCAASGWADVSGSGERSRHLHCCACRIGRRRPFSSVRLRARPGSIWSEDRRTRVRALPDTPSGVSVPGRPARQHHPEGQCALTFGPGPHAARPGASHRLAAPSRCCHPHLACLPIIVFPSGPSVERPSLHHFCCGAASFRLCLACAEHRPSLTPGSPFPAPLAGALSNVQSMIYIAVFQRFFRSSVRFPSVFPTSQRCHDIRVVASENR